MSTGTDMNPLITEIQRLARTRVHRVSARQLAHPETMTVKSALALRDYLARQPVDEAAVARAREWERQAWAAQERDIAAQVGHATAAALTAATGDPAGRTASARISPYAKAGGHPASDDAGEKDPACRRDQAEQAPAGRSPAPARRVPSAERPQADGYFYHEKRIYKVATSQYGASKGHLFARKLDEQAGEWIPAKGMTSYLSEAERITPEKAMEIGRRLSRDPSLALYGKCWICGRVLTDETSIANGKGPGPHIGMDD